MGSCFKQILLSALWGEHVMRGRDGNWEPSAKTASGS